jgi:rhodanese-related sulfurtransferase
LLKTSFLVYPRGYNKRSIVKQIFKLVAAILVALTATLSLTSCSAEKVDMASVAAVIDVRTPVEFTSGHLEGAVNFNIQGMSFMDELATLDPNATYLVYCRSGSRAAAAVDTMKSMGIDNVTNLGSVNDAASATGLAVVTG